MLPPLVSRLRLGSAPAERHRLSNEPLEAFPQMLINLPRARHLMGEAKVDAIVATTYSNVAYMSDYHSVSSLITPRVQSFGVVTAGDDPRLALILPSLEVDAWAEQPGEVHDAYVYGFVHRYVADSPLAED